MRPDHPVEAPPVHLSGKLDLCFGTDARGVTRLLRRYRTGHYHVGKPYHDGRQLVVQVVNTTAGIFEKDSLRSRFECGPGARACLLSPSSSQVYSMPGGGGADSSQLIQVSSGGSLAVLPRWLVPHRGSRFQQVTRIELDPQSRFFYLEPVSAGRLSHGEFLEMDQLLCHMEIRVGDKLVLVERIRVGNSCNRWTMERGGERYPYLASAYIHFPGAGEFCQQNLARLPEAHKSRGIGMSALSDDLVVVRLLGRTGSGINASLRNLYRLLATEVPISPVLQRI